MSYVPIVQGRAAVGGELFISGVHGVAVALHRGPSHYSPDGEHCCVSGDPAQRKCVTFSELLTIIIFYVQY